MVRFTEDGGESGDTADLAPVIPLFGARPDAPARGGARGGWHETWGVTSGAFDGESAGVRPTRETGVRAEEPASDDDVRAAAEARLLRRLRTRSLSVKEARGILVDDGLDAADADELIEVFLGRGYLDDAALAEQLVHVGVDRKGQGRQVISRTLATRGIPRDVADEALDAMPDDDFERALEFARTKTRSLRSLDPDVALRRLVGQLARRGYGGGLAMTVAKQALGEASGPASGVRFR